MRALDPVAVVGTAVTVNFRDQAAACAIIANESPYAQKVAIATRERWLPAWTADLFELPLGTTQLILTPALIGSLSGAPSFTTLISIGVEGDVVTGTYPMALTRQASLAGGSVNVPTLPPTPVFLENGAATPIGDTSANALVADLIQDVCSAPPGSGGCAAIASFKAAAGQTPARRGAAGAMALGTNTQVSPAYAAATQAGNLAICVVGDGNTSGTGQVPTTNAAGWVEAVHSDPLAGFNIVSIWYKPNIGANEVAPVFTSSNSTSPMIAQLLEVTGCATSSPLDQTGSQAFSGSGPAKPQCVAADAAGQDFVVEGDRWIGTLGTEVFTATVNNGATLTQDGVGTTVARTLVVNHAVNPASTPNLPLGVQEWPYDVNADGSAAANTVLTVTIVGAAGKRIIIDQVTAGYFQSGASGNGGVVTLSDGTTTFVRAAYNLPPTVGSGPPSSQYRGSWKGGVGATMTLTMPAFTTGVTEAVMGGYQR